MRKFRFILGLLLVSVGLSAQQSLLVFMEASEKKSFYVRLGSKTTASSATGQVFINELTGIGLEIFVGFPETEIPEQRFQITLKKNDHNFQLKQSSGQGWTLIDLESNQTIQASGAPVKTTASIGGVKKTDAFSIMMAGVVNDTAVLYTSVITPEVVADKVPKADKTSPAITSPPITSPALPKPDQGKTTGVSTEVASTEKNRVTANADSSQKQTDSSLAQLKVEQRNEKKADSPVAAAQKAVTVDSPARQTSPPVLVKNDAKSDSVSQKTDASVPSNLPSKKDSVLKEVARTDSAVTTPTTAAATPASFPAILKISEKKTDSELILAYTEKGPDGKIDTIRISIPVDPEVSIVPKKDSVKRWQANPRPLRDTLMVKADSVRKSNSSQAKTDNVLTSAEYQYRVDSIQKSILSQAKTDSLLKSGKSLSKTDSVHRSPSSVWNTDSSRKANTSVVKKDSAGKANSVNGQPVTKAPAMINSDCVNFATEYDLDKLRVRMVDEVSAEDRIAAAKKIFRTKCFSTRQIRALTELFLNDEGKYKFLDAAYPFVSDSHDFRKLADVLKEDYYVKRFHAMIRS